MARSVLGVLQAASTTGSGGGGGVAKAAGVAAATAAPAAAAAATTERTLTASDSPTGKVLAMVCVFVCLCVFMCVRANDPIIGAIIGGKLCEKRVFAGVYAVVHAYII